MDNFRLLGLILAVIAGLFSSLSYAYEFEYEREEEVTVEEEELRPQDLSLESSVHDYLRDAGIDPSVARSGNGWGSSGGGEYILTRNNPWFVGKTKEFNSNEKVSPVNWCLIHDANQFSLDYQSAKREVEKGLRDITGQLSERENYQQFNYLTAKYRAELKFEATCNDSTDLQIILGATNHPHIQSLISSYGEKQFKKLTGIAIRRNYSEKTLSGQGFIYLAADKGPLKYEGDTLFEDNAGFWSYFQRISKYREFPIPVNPAIDLQRNLVTSLRVVTAHEVAHAYGFRHDLYWLQMMDYFNRGTPGEMRSLMNEDTPASIVAKGYMLNHNYKLLKDLTNFSFNHPKNIDNTPINHKAFISMTINFHDGLLDSFEGLKELFLGSQDYEGHPYYWPYPYDYMAKFTPRDIVLEIPLYTKNTAQKTIKAKIHFVKLNNPIKVCQKELKESERKFRRCYKKIRRKGKKKFSYIIENTLEFDIDLTSEERTFYRKWQSSFINIPYLTKTKEETFLDELGNLFKGPQFPFENFNGNYNYLSWEFRFTGRLHLNSSVSWPISIRLPRALESRSAGIYGSFDFIRDPGSNPAEVSFGDILARGYEVGETFNKVLFE